MQSSALATFVQMLFRPPKVNIYAYKRFRGGKGIEVGKRGRGDRGSRGKGGGWRARKMVKCTLQNMEERAAETKFKGSKTNESKANMRAIIQETESNQTMKKANTTSAQETKHPPKQK